MHHIKLLSIHDDVISIPVAVLATCVDTANSDTFGYELVRDVCLSMAAGFIPD